MAKEDHTSAAETFNQIAPCSEAVIDLHNLWPRPRRRGKDLDTAPDIDQYTEGIGRKIQVR